MMWRITCLLNNLEADITGPPKLLAEISEARHQTNRCEYYIAKNYLGWVIELGSTRAKRRLMKIIKLLDWCTENDRRGSYTWQKPVKRAT